MKKKIFSKFQEFDTGLSGPAMIGFNFEDNIIHSTKMILRSVYVGLSIMIMNSEGKWGNMTFRPSSIILKNFKKNIIILEHEIDYTIFIQIPQYLNECFGMTYNTISKRFALNNIILLGSSECIIGDRTNLYPVSLSSNHRSFWNHWNINIYPKLLTNEILNIVPQQLDSKNNILIPEKTDIQFNKDKTDIFIKAENEWIAGWDDYTVTNNLVLGVDYDLQFIDFIVNAIIRVYDKNNKLEN